MNKKIGIVLVLSCMFFLSSCSLKSNSSKASRAECMTNCADSWNSSKSNAGRTEDEMNKECSSICDANQGIKNKDENFCAKAEGTTRSDCYIEIAKNGKPEACEKLEDKNAIADCYLSVVEKTGDKSICEKIMVSMVKDACLENN